MLVGFRVGIFLIVMTLYQPQALDRLPAAMAEEPNYAEDLVRPYTLPDVLAGPDAVPAQTISQWKTISRPHQLRQLEKFVYGKQLPAVVVQEVGSTRRSSLTLAGDVPAERIETRLRMGTAADAPTVDILVVLPKKNMPAPCCLSLHFAGTEAETAIPPKGQSWGQSWPVAAMLNRGYGMATVACNDFFPDRPDGRSESVLKSLGRPVGPNLAEDEPGAVAAWAWGLSRVLDWLVTLPEVDPKKVIVVGHSRLGKAALWAGACDDRFALVISNQSGCGGAALSRRNYGETVASITKQFPHWFCPAFATYANREMELPCDQHALLAMIAPRPLYVASASDDRWADPRGEFLAASAAGPVWKLFGTLGLETVAFPTLDMPIGHDNGYRVRTGKHSLLPSDWQHFADFADQHLLTRAVDPVDVEDVFHPLQSQLPAGAPRNAIVLLDTQPSEPLTLVTAQFVSMSGGPIDWPIKEGAMEVKTSPGHANHIISTISFRDADIHAEFMTTAVHQGNSGLYLHGHYEMQIFDSFGVDPPTDQDEGSLYRFGKPLVAAARPVGEWQVYDIRFRAPRRNAQKKITQAGSITAWLNGKKVQDNIQFKEPRSPYIPYKHGVTDYLRGVEKHLLETGSGPLFLQDHGSPVRFRNIWIVPLDDAAVIEPLNKD